MQYMNKLQSVHSGSLAYPPALNPNQSGHSASGSAVAASSIHHPAPSVPSAVPFTGRFSAALHEQHRSLELPQVLALIREQVARQWWSTQVVGSWVWVYQSPRLSH